MIASVVEATAASTAAVKLFLSNTSSNLVNYLKLVSCITLGNLEINVGKKLVIIISFSLVFIRKSKQLL